jgi:hypothetical protein
MNAMQQSSLQTKSSIQPKEKTSREKALEFSKNNVPKPKQRKLSQADSTVSNSNPTRGTDESVYGGQGQPANGQYGSNINVM